MTTPATFDQTSERRLTSVHPDLVRVLRLARTIAPLEFRVTEGVRSRERQEQLVAAGASKTMNSRHLKSPRTGFAYAADLVVIVAGKARWDWPLYRELAIAVKAAADELGIPIEWGGDWKTFKDGPHFQLPHKQYPA